MKPVLLGCKWSLTRMNRCAFIRAAGLAVVLPNLSER